MTHHLRSAVVLGAGTMGAQIAAHLANAHIPVLLLDVTAEAAAAGLARARTLKPDPFYVPEAVNLIRTGSLDDLSPLATADWIIEAIVEDMAIKQSLVARIDEVRGPESVVSSNTSGIPLAAIAEGRGPVDALRRSLEVARADYAHAVGGLATVVVLFYLTRILLEGLLRSQADNTIRVAVLLSDVVLSPMIMLGGALLFTNLVARVGVVRGERKRARAEAMAAARGGGRPQ